MGGAESLYFQGDRTVQNILALLCLAHLCADEGRGNTTSGVLSEGVSTMGKVYVVAAILALQGLGHNCSKAV